MMILQYCVCFKSFNILQKFSKLKIPFFSNFNYIYYFLTELQTKIGLRIFLF